MSSKYPLVAIVGAGALFPGSLTEGRFWQNILEGQDLLSPVPESHWLLDDYYDPDPQAPDRTYANRGGFLPEVDFAPMDFGVPPNIIPATDTAQLLALNIAKRVLEDAAQGDFSGMDRDRISVVLGVASATELVGHMSGRLQRPVWERALRNIGLADDQVQAFSDEISASYTPWQESTFPGLLGNVVAGRIANRLDLGGTNCVVDAACASSLAALEIGLNELYLGQSDMVITGGVDTLNDILMFMCFSRTTALSPSGDCRPFSDQADGTMLGEGIGMFALKRLDDAERDGDKVYAVIQGLGSSSDGRSKSIYAPVSSGQAKALRRAYEHAGYGPETVELIEAHGTGTKAGDAAEVGGLNLVFKEESARQDRQWCAIGSVKSQIGHTKASAGAAGLFKTAMALHHKVIPPTIKVDQPNPMLDLENSPFYISTQARPWIRGSDHPRRASVSSFGFGGTNFHVALQEYEGNGKRADKLRAQPVELFTWSADTAIALGALLQPLVEPLGQDQDDAFFDFIAHQSVQNYQAKNPARLAIVAEGAEDLQKKLKLILDHLGKHPERTYATPNGVHYGFDQQPGEVAFLFPGQGSQYINMGNQLAIHFEEARKVWDRTADITFDPGKKLHDVVFPPTPFSEETSQNQLSTLTATEWAQPSIGATSLAALALFDAMGIKPACVGGHSFGEVTSMYAAGVIDEESFMKIARKRGELMALASELDGSMTAVVAEVGVVRDHLDAWGLEVVVANHNSPTQVVISGATPAIEQAEEKLAAAGLKFKRLQVATAFHSPLVSDSSVPFKSFLDELEFGTPRIPIYSNALAQPYPDGAEEIRALLANQVAEPVRFVEQLEAMYAAGVRTFVEVGPEGVLTSLVGRTLTQDDVVAVSTDRRGKHGVETLYLALAQLVSRGVAMNFSLLWDGYKVPVDPRTIKQAPFQITLNGANYGKPSPFREPGQSARDSAVTLNTPREIERIVEVPVEVIVERVVEVPVHEVAAPAQRQAQRSPQTAPQQPHEGAAPASDWLMAMDRMQHETARAQFEYQRMMSDAHTAFLKAAETSMQQLIGSEHNTVTHTPAPRAAFVEPMVSSPLTKSFHNGLNGHAHIPSPMTAPELFAPTKQSTPITLETRATSHAPVIKAPAPVAPTPTPPAKATAPTPEPSAAPAVDMTHIMLEVVAEKTGYPTEMLELSMELEADLGIDSIKRVEILSAMQERVPSLPEVETSKMASLVTLQEIVDYMSSLLAASGGAVSKPAATPAAAQAAAVAPQQAARVDLVPIMLDVVAEKTGYPTEMLELSMELEADLGIDSIKRVEILSAMQERVPSLPEVETSKMASLVTLQEIVDYMSSLLQNAAPAPTSAPVSAPAARLASAAPAVDLVPIMLEVVAEKTGYPTEMLELSMELEADLGIDSIKRVEILSAMQERVPSLPEVETSKMASLVTLQEIVDYMSSLLAGATQVAAPGAQAAPQAPQAQSKAPQESTARIDLVPVMLEVVAEKTGYPAEMLDLSMELEADLGIDSIKRVEILSAMQERVPSLPEVETSKMASLVTLQQIVDYMSSLLAGVSAPTTQTQTTAKVTPDFSRREDTSKGVLPVLEEVSDIIEDVARYEVHLVDAPARHLAITGIDHVRTAEIISAGGGIAQALAFQLEQRGVQGLVVDSVDALTGNAQMVIDLGGLRPVTSFEDGLAINRDAFRAAARMAEKFSSERGIFITVQDTGGDFGTTGSRDRAWIGGLGALMKTAQKEWPLSTTRAIDLERGDRPAGDLATALLDELWQGGNEIEVALDVHGNRRTLAAFPRRVGASGRTINKSSVIVVSGGARGVTAASIVELARQTRAGFVLLGRTELEEEPALFQGKTSDADLKRAALEEVKSKGLKVSPKELNNRVYRIKADREVRQTLQDLEDAGARARYASVDVRDVDALELLFNDVRQQWGGITGIVHGAGVLADAFLTKKTVENFDHVFGTKILGLKALLDATSDDDLEVICLFSSVAARTGNAGQADYAMANEVLNRVAAELARARTDCNVKSLGWGPWEGGMVTPELAALFEQRGVALIPVLAGARAFAAELLEESSGRAVEVVLGGGVVDGGLNTLIPTDATITSTLNVSQTSHPYLVDHTIQGKVVLPVVIGMEWCVRAAQSAQPGSIVQGVHNLKVLKGVALSGFTASGDVFGVELSQLPEGLVKASLNDRAGLARYEVQVELGESTPEVLPFTTLQEPLTPSPWESLDAIYADDTLFHGPKFQVIQSIEGFSDEGARATLVGLLDKNISGDGWLTDALLLDGCLQLALLWGLRVSKGQSLPMRIAQARFYQPPQSGALTCELVGQQFSGQRTVCDIRVTNAAGEPVCDLRGVEMYVVPGGTASK